MNPYNPKETFRKTDPNFDAGIAVIVALILGFFAGFLFNILIGI